MSSLLALQSSSKADDLPAFKRKVYSHLAKTGVVSSIKTQLRSHLVDTLVSQQAGASQLRSGTNEEHILNLFRTFLEWHGLKYTLSVLDMEFGGCNSSQNMLGDNAIINVLGLLKPNSDVLQLNLLEGYQSVQDKLSFPAFLLQELLKGCGTDHRCDAGCQTDATAGSSLAHKLQEVSCRYEACPNQNKLQDDDSRLVSDSTAKGTKQLQSELSTRTIQADEAFLLDAFSWRKQQTEQMRIDTQRAQQKLKLYQEEIEHAAFEHRQQLLQEQARLLAWQAQLHKHYQTQQAELQAAKLQIGSKEQLCVEKEATAKQQLVSAVQLVEKVQADALQAAEQERSRHQSDVHAMNQQWQEVLANMKAEQQELLQKLQHSEQEKEKALAASVQLQTLCADAQQRYHHLEADFSSLKSELEQFQSKASHEQSLLESKAMAADKKVEHLQQQLVENGMPPSAPLELQITMLLQNFRKLQSEQQVLQQELRQSSRQLAEWKARTAEAERCLRQAVTGKDDVARQLDEVCTAAMQYEEENQHLRSRMSILKQEAVASRIKQPGSPMPGSPMSPSGLANAHSRTPLPVAYSPLVPSLKSLAVVAPISPSTAVHTSDTQLVASSFRERLEELGKLDAAVRKEHNVTRQRISQYRFKADSILTALHSRHAAVIDTTVGASSGANCRQNEVEAMPRAWLSLSDPSYEMAGAGADHDAWAKMHLPPTLTMETAAGSTSQAYMDQVLNISSNRSPSWEKPSVPIQLPTICPPSQSREDPPFGARGDNQLNGLLTIPETNWQQPLTGTQFQPVGVSMPTAQAPSDYPKPAMVACTTEPKDGTKEHTGHLRNTTAAAAATFIAVAQPQLATSFDCSNKPHLAIVQQDQQKQLPVITPWQDPPETGMHLRGSPPSTEITRSTSLRSSGSVLSDPCSTTAVGAGAVPGNSVHSMSSAQSSSESQDAANIPAPAKPLHLIITSSDDSFDSSMVSRRSFPELSNMLSESSSNKSSVSLPTFPEGPSQEVEVSALDQIETVHDRLSMSDATEEGLIYDQADEEEEATVLGHETDGKFLVAEMTEQMGNSLDEIAADFKSVHDSSASSEDSVF